MSEPTNTTPAIDNNRYWLFRGALLLLWAVVSFVVVFHARDWSFTVAGWPFGYWMAAQGGVLVFIVIVVVYAVFMNAMDRRAQANREALAPQETDA